MSGCHQRIADFTAISTKNVEVKGTRGRRVRGEDKAWYVLIFPTSVPSLKTAIDDALKEDGDILVDTVLYADAWWAVLFGRFGYVVEGTAVRTKDLETPARPR